MLRRGFNDQLGFFTQGLDGSHPDAANLLLPLGNSHLDQEPLLAITAQLPDEFPHTHTHQRLPLHDTFRVSDDCE